LGLKNNKITMEHKSAEGKQLDMETGIGGIAAVERIDLSKFEIS